MYEESKDVHLIYHKRKHGEPLSEEEQQTWNNYRLQYPEPDPSKFDEEELRLFIRLEKSLLPWDEFKRMHRIEFPG